jgi:hypothetical protein
MKKYFYRHILVRRIYSFYVESLLKRFNIHIILVAVVFNYFWIIRSALIINIPSLIIIMKPKHFIKSLFILFFLGGSLLSNAQDPARLKSIELNEVSGLVLSRNNTMYVHNDSGDTTRFFAINSGGDLVATIYFKGDPIRKIKGVLDCEDIAYGPGPEKGKNYIYLGDIGDNSAMRRYISVYRLPEPGKLQSVMHVNRELVHLKYPNGPQDAETMMVDPILKELIIVSKRQDTVGIYSTPLSFKDGDTVKLQKTGSLFLPRGITPASKYITAGDISADGKQILLKTYQNVYYWQRQGSEPVNQTLSRKPIQLPYIRERQGESIGFTPDGKGYYCISEGVNAVIYYYPLNTQVIDQASK